MAFTVGRAVKPGEDTRTLYVDCGTLTGLGFVVALAVDITVGRERRAVTSV